MSVVRPKSAILTVKSLSILIVRKVVTIQNKCRVTISSGDYNSQPFKDQLACLSDQNMFASDIKDWSKDIGRCISHCLYMSSTVFMYPIKTLHLVARRCYMVPTQGGVSFPLEGLFYCLLLLPGIMSDQNTTMSPHLSRSLNNYNLHCYMYLLVNNVLIINKA